VRKVRIGLLGCGTVGGGVVQLLHANASYLASRVGAPLEVADGFVARPFGGFRGLGRLTGLADRLLRGGDGLGAGGPLAFRTGPFRFFSFGPGPFGQPLIGLGQRRGLQCSAQVDEVTCRLGLGRHHATPRALS